jgi:RsiW-degrading membrane proteinase PrsW (M82 family)
MSTKTALKILFSCILLTLLIYTAWASVQQPVLQWGGLTSGRDRYWTIATLMDAYFGFLTFYVWVFYKEARTSLRIAWFIAIMLLGNMAMSAYVLAQLLKLRPDQDASAILWTRNRCSPP